MTLLILLFTLTTWEHTVDGCSSGIAPQFSTIGSKWRGPVRFIVNVTDMPTGVSTADIQKAVDAWARQITLPVTLDFDFYAPRQRDGINTISFQPTGRDLLGSTVVWSEPIGDVGPGGTAEAWKIVEADIVISSDNEWLREAHRFRQVVAHEIGHALGLRHSEDSNALMWPIADPDKDATLAPDDRRGILSLYEPALTIRKRRQMVGREGRHKK